MKDRVALVLLALVGAAPALAAPASVVVGGSFQSEAGCAGDWQADCAATGLAQQPDSGVWRAAWSLPAGSYEYKATLNGTWDENYGAHGVPGGDVIGLVLAAPREVRFYYDDATHWVTDSVGSRIVTAPGNYQTAIGCPGIWDPTCLRSWLQDADGDGIYELETTAIPAGSYAVKAAIDESWDENYGIGGVSNGPQIEFSVPADGTPVHFRFESATNLLSVPEPSGVATALVALAALGLCCARS